MFILIPQPWGSLVDAIVRHKALTFLGTVASIVSLLLSVLMARESGAKPLLRENPELRIKSPAPTTESLALRHSNSKTLLEAHLQTRDSTDERTRSTSLLNLETALDTESTILGHDLETICLLKLMHGAFLRNSGRPSEAIIELEALRSEMHRNPFILGELWLAYRSRDFQLRATDRPWPDDIQRELQELGPKQRELEEELQPFQRAVLDELLGSESSPPDRLAAAHAHAEIILSTPHPPMAEVYNTTGMTGRWSSADKNAANESAREGPTTAGEARSATLARSPAMALHIAELRSAREVYSSALSLWRTCEQGDSRGICAEPAALRRDYNCDNVAGVLCSLIDNLDPEGAATNTRAVRSVHLAALGAMKSLDASRLGLRDHSPPAARLLAFAIDRYTEPRFEPLRYAVADAERIKEVMEEMYDAQTSLTANEAATRNKILEILTAEVLRSRPGEELLLYFSGHGYRAADGQAMFATAGGRGGVSLDEIRALLTYHRGTPIVVADSCASHFAFKDRRPTRFSAEGPNEPIFVTLDEDNGFGYESDRLRASLLTVKLVQALDREKLTVPVISFPLSTVRVEAGSSLTEAWDGLINFFKSKEPDHEQMN